MIAKEMFEKLGYEQKIYNNEKDISLNGIDYIKENKNVVQIVIKHIEFYTLSKEIVIYTTYEYTDGIKTTGDAGIMNFEEFNAIQRQIIELNWQN